MTMMQRKTHHGGKTGILVANLAAADGLQTVAPMAPLISYDGNHRTRRLFH